MQTKLVSKESDDIAQIVVTLHIQVSEKIELVIQELILDDIKVEKKAGGSIT